MTSTLVTGGTGTLGRRVTGLLSERGHEVRVLSRHARPYAVDLLDARDEPALLAALDGVGTVVHCATGPRGDDVAAGRLLAAARRAGVGHLVYISIVGVDRVPLGYYRVKERVERLIEEAAASGGPDCTILRTTQFHDLVLRVLAGAARAPFVLPVPAGVSVQPVDVSEVAARLADLAGSAPAGRVPDMGGPEIRSFPSLAHAYLDAAARRRRVLSVPLAGKAYAAFRAGGHLTPERAVGTVRFEDFLAARRPRVPAGPVSPERRGPGGRRGPRR
ncbi:SDR family oxidoreductase [Streptomyces sp. HNM0663]|uniref:SDR family oxidoreductase n=1 Tax=Streptomyces chengmaiensis TaxID=3040919 RepID=A0ABT6HXH5_9ACTN|nr:SDR family oxidoreductase [Streptomyces chengmaiensis]MDH2392769.1 SDR family oxidoreductase [Streptomyces chengmaiensis]